MKRLLGLLLLLTLPLKAEVKNWFFDFHQKTCINETAVSFSAGAKIQQKSTSQTSGIYNANQTNFTLTGSTRAIFHIDENGKERPMPYTVIWTKNPDGSFKGIAKDSDPKGDVEMTLRLLDDTSFTIERTLAGIFKMRVTGKKEGHTLRGKIVVMGIDEKPIGSGEYLTTQVAK